MSEPRIEIIPLRAAVRSDETTTLDVLVRVVPPIPEIHFVRPTLNIGLVLDRSGSMAGAKKMAYAREAAEFAVQQFLATDRVSMTVFDNIVETIAPNAPVVDKPGLIRRIKEIKERGATDLHAGWNEGCQQVAGHLVGDGLNRVILLSDGQANEGVTDPAVIARQVKARAAEGVSTTTMGLGDDYNEDLLQAMGEAGDGNYYYIESPVQLTDIFQTELKGLMANVGQKVSLGVEPGKGGSVVEVLNDLDRNPLGRWMLPNLIVGMPILIVVRLKVPATAREAEICRFRLAWDNPRGNRREVFHANLTMGSCSSERWETLPVNPIVAEQVALLMSARAKKEAISAYDRGDMALTRSCVELAQGLMEAMPPSPMVHQELDALNMLEADLAEGNGTKFRKRSSAQAYERKQGRGSS